MTPPPTQTNTQPENQTNKQTTHKKHNMYGWRQNPSKARLRFIREPTVRESFYLDFRSEHSTTQIREGHGTAMCQSHPTQPCRRSCVSKHVTNRPTHGPTLPYCPPSEGLMRAQTCHHRHLQICPSHGVPLAPNRAFLLPSVNNLSTMCQQI